VAVALEESLAKIADIGTKLIQRNSKIRLKTDSGEVFIPSQLAAERIKIRVAGHSHSPLFADESKEQAAGLFKGQAIDREDLLRMLNPPDVDHLIWKLRRRVKAEAQEKAQQVKAEQNKPHRGSHPSKAA
jgi:siroheme synthase (precorrin-2 oxidase/ferrochelatase)